MANVLIPTDFTANSLQLAAQAIQALDDKAINIVLFHAFAQPESEFDLLIPSRYKPHANLVTEALRQSCKQFKEQNSNKVQKIYFRFMEGETAPMFRNFIDANEIDLIYCPETYTPVKVNKYSADPRPLFKKSGIPVIQEHSRPRLKVIPHNMEAVSAPTIADMALQASS